jgi:hypothetical protein
MDVYKLLHTAQKNINYPKLRVIPFASKPNFVLMFTIAGERAAVPGSINITTDQEVFDRRVFFGRILDTGETMIQESIQTMKITPSSTVQEITKDLISKIDSDLLKYLRKTSYLSNKCPMCWKEIHDDYSKLVGWGPDCAQKWGIEWKEFDSEEFNKKIEQMKKDIIEVLSNTGKYDPHVIFAKVKNSKGKSLDELQTKYKEVVQFINQCEAIESWLQKLIKVINSEDFTNFIYDALHKYCNTKKFVILEEKQKIMDLLNSWNVFKRSPNSLKKIYNPLFLGPLWNQHVIKTVSSGKIILDKNILFKAI